MNKSLRQPHQQTNPPEIERQADKISLTLHCVEPPQTELTEAQNQFDLAIDRLN
ncbi:hypothetical protein LL273_16445 [Marinobacter salarius]|uniref:Uncharacterized protein n=1 Tax=Marinobacter salarius TaxID=1420917 RepID=A0A1W6KB07_9GAMM|nr:MULTISPECIES: hypothetical protein [Marinobacter]ARM84492.1 hypothetical protein MARSALSMR5_02427 [Marinobacter salarius]MCC4285312.1 hypothetical protein [Marinobacter salarius]MCZ4285532.1 hypothetical protein [Marinobacter salarius]MDC8457008.1 hypothetical protein [Marinobacter sp. DS40M6]VVS97639.1 conserved hypothetical protein [Marinobacter salarius]